MRSCQDVFGTTFYDKNIIHKLRWRGKKIPVDILHIQNTNMCKASWLDGFLEMQNGWCEKNSGFIVTVCEKAFSYFDAIF